MQHSARRLCLVVETFVFLLLAILREGRGSQQEDVVHRCVDAERASFEARFLLGVGRPKQVYFSILDSEL